MQPLITTPDHCSPIMLWSTGHFSTSEREVRSKVLMPRKCFDFNRIHNLPIAEARFCFETKVWMLYLETVTKNGRSKNETSATISTLGMGGIGNLILVTSKKLVSITVSNAKKWFEDALRTSTWLVDDQIDLAMELLRDRARRYSRSYDSPSRVILSYEFVRVVDIEHYKLISKGNKYVLSEHMLDWVIGLQLRCRKLWTDCTHMYIPVIANSLFFSGNRIC
ncbi:uncharacterized protein LOC111386332 isoform X1 [Olea europaea var. sylvestris]|uniref:uncharacterized protein LOC111386332 isoform X1 n=1 Tax=Olea europaea var. sylvestris TaxID=158386 RepID=UPI000C1CF698|nr:uncharacterized protein LOC111386332 isoform X1 [Olea europaea var. sylvestris]